MSSSGPHKFRDFVPPTTIIYEKKIPTLRLRRCAITSSDGKRHTSDHDVIRIGSMENNDIVLDDDTVSRHHCRVVQDSTGYVLIDLHSTNGTSIDGVRIREAFLHSGCTISVGQSKLVFHAQDEEVEITPSATDRCGQLIGRTAQMRQLHSIIEKIAPTAATVIVEGETGTGKEVVAQSIHSLSRRADNELIIFDCGAVPPNLIESELFGHEKGSFTGALMTRQGLFELADGSTLFLDELGELPLDLQPKLLRALEQREIRRVGSTKPINVDVRIIAATNRNLEEEVKAGRFRQDLFYRLSVVKLNLPALRDRIEDIALLCRHFLDTGRYNRRPDGSLRATGIADAALACLTKYSWPGNVRELVNVIERAVSLSEGPLIEPGDLPDYLRPAGLSSDTGVPFSGGDGWHKPVLRGPGVGGVEDGGVSSGPTPVPPPEFTDGDITFKDAKERWVASFEREYLTAMLKRHNGNISHAARESDIDRKYFRKLMRKYDIDARVGSRE